MRDYEFHVFGADEHKSMKKTLLTIAAAAALLAGCSVHEAEPKAPSEAVTYLVSLGYSDIKLDETHNPFPCSRDRYPAYGVVFQARDKDESIGGIVCTGGYLPPSARIDRRWKG